MEPINSLIERAWESLTEGWRESCARQWRADTFPYRGCAKGRVAAGVSALEFACGGDVGDSPFGGDSGGVFRG